MARNYGWQLSVHTHFNRKNFFSFSFAEGGLSPKLISPPTPAMYKYRPAFSNNPKVHYHATAEQVSEPGSFCSHLMPGSVELRMNSLQGSSECQGVKVNNNTWHCCVTVYYFHCAPYGNMSGFTASPCWHVCPTARRALLLLRCLSLILGCWEVSPPIGFSWQRCHLTSPSERAWHAEFFSGSDPLANTQCTHWFFKKLACKTERTFKASWEIF